MASSIRDSFRSFHDAIDHAVKQLEATVLRKVEELEGRIKALEVEVERRSSERPLPQSSGMPHKQVDTRYCVVIVQLRIVMQVKITTLEYIPFIHLFQHCNLPECFSRR